MTRQEAELVRVIFRTGEMIRHAQLGTPYTEDLSTTPPTNWRR